MNIKFPVVLGTYQALLVKIYHGHIENFAVLTVAVFVPSDQYPGSWEYYTTLVSAHIFDLHSIQTTKAPRQKNAHNIYVASQQQQ